MRRNKKERPLQGAAPLFQKLQQNRGEFTINGAISLLFAMMLLVLFISALSAVNTSMKLHSVAADLSRYIELRGKVDSAVYTELDRLAGVAGVTVETRSIVGTFSDGSKLQLGSDFTITLTTTGHIGIGGVLSLPVPLKTKVTGRSERYWK